MLTAIDVPSKGRFDLIQITLNYIRDGKSMRRLAREIDQDVRHAHFMVQNARILGFAISDGSKVRLTKSGSDFIDASPRLKGFLLCRALLASRVISELMKKKGILGDIACLSKEEISDFLVENAVVSRTDNSPMQRVTANRRASSVRHWLTWLEKNLPFIHEVPEQQTKTNFQETLES
jgi:hypothetical protein